MKLQCDKTICRRQQVENERKGVKEGEELMGESEHRQGEQTERGRTSKWGEVKKRKE